MKEKILAGKTFCITGKLSHSRKCYEEMIEALGGRVVGRISGNVDFLLHGFNDDESEKERKAEELGTSMINERAFYAMAGATYEEFLKQKVTQRIAERDAYEKSFAGKWECLKSAALVAIGKLENTMLMPTENTRIYVHYVLSVRTLAARVQCISAHGVAFNNHNGKSIFLDWNQVEPARLMEIADYIAKLRDLDKNSFRSRYRALLREEEKRAKEVEKLSA